MSLLVSVTLAACYPSYGPPVAMPRPILIDGINSPFDDVNASDPGIPYRQELVFSTNRATNGGTFDLWVTRLEWTRPLDDDAGPARVWASRTAEPYTPTVNSDANERSPIILVDPWFGDEGLFAFASDRPGGAGGFDLYAASCPSRYPYCQADGAIAPLPVNTPADEMYLTRPFAPRQLLFASNRDSIVGAGPTTGPNDIYAARWPDMQAITVPPASVERVAALSSEGDDTAPFVYMAGDTPEVVFVSNRAGSLGEHDIYCSRFVRGAWQSPVHAKVASSPSDELRPIVTEIKGVRFMIFSSNRPGGEGGYDLYVVGYSACR